jgi:hypothetical protein
MSICGMLIIENLDMELAATKTHPLHYTNPFRIKNQATNKSHNLIMVKKKAL